MKRIALLQFCNVLSRSFWGALKKWKLIFELEKMLEMILKWMIFTLILFVSCIFLKCWQKIRNLEHFVKFLKWLENKFEVFVRSIVRPRAILNFVGASLYFSVTLCQQPHAVKVTYHQWPQKEDIPKSWEDYFENQSGISIGSNRKLRDGCVHYQLPATVFIVTILRFLVASSGVTTNFLNPTANLLMQQHAAANYKPARPELVSCERTSSLVMPTARPGQGL
jgi:hypothetical protein